MRGQADRARRQQRAAKSEYWELAYLCHSLSEKRWHKRSRARAMRREARVRTRLPDAVAEYDDAVAMLRMPEFCDRPCCADVREGIARAAPGPSAIDGPSLRVSFAEAVRIGAG